MGEGLRIRKDTPPPRDRQSISPGGIEFVTWLPADPAVDLRNPQEARGVFRPRSGRIGFRREQPLSHAGAWYPRYLIRQNDAVIY